MPLEIFGKIVIGIGIGIVIPIVGAQLVKLRIVCASNDLEPLYAFSIALLVFAIASITHANEFLATFLAGIFLTTVCPKSREEFHRFDQTAAELLKLIALLIFGTLISTSWFGSSNWRTSLFILLALIAVRPAALSLSLWKSGLTAKQSITTACFGPKGFASVVYAVMLLHANLHNGIYLFHLVALVVASSIILHTCTDVLAARWYESRDPV